MGKGKRNRQLHIEDKQANPQKQKARSKKQFVMPKWAKMTICFVVLAAILFGSIAISLLNNGIVYRTRVLVESDSGKYDINQQMATFILWQNMYQQAYYEYLYTQYGMYTDTNNILKTYSSAADYGIAMAAYYTTSILQTGLSSISEYLLSLTAGADAAVKEGLKLEAHDKAEIKQVVTWMQSVYASSQYASYMTFKNFLNTAVGESFQITDIESAARLLVMYTKYADYKSLDLDDNATLDQLQDFILKNPSGHFEAKYYSYSGASEEMIREFFGSNFVKENAKVAYAKYLATLDKKATESLKDSALTEKLTALGITSTEYKKETNDDGEATYTPELIDEIAEIAFNTSNKKESFVIVGGEDCAYLVYFFANATSTTAKLGYKKYTGTLPEGYEDLLISSIKAGENTSEYKSGDDLGIELMIKLDADKNDMPTDALEAITKNPDKFADYNNTAPNEILEVLYAKSASFVKDQTMQINNDGVTYVFKVTAVEKDETTSTNFYTISYVKYEDSEFCAVLRVFEEEFAALLSTSTAAPTYSLTYEVFKTNVLNFIMDENFESLVVNHYVAEDYKQIEAYVNATEKSDIEIYQSKLLALFGIEATKYSNNTTTRESLDDAVYDFIFNSKNLGKTSIIQGEDGVYLVYVFPAEDTTGSDSTSTENSVKAGWKKYTFDTLKFDSDDAKETVKGFYDLILKDLTTDDRKNTTTHKSANDLAKAFLEKLNAGTENMPTDADTATTTDPDISGATNTAPDAILDYLYADSAKIEKGKNYQVDNNGTSYVVKVTDIPTADDASTTSKNETSYKITYTTYTDSEYYSYFRAIKSALDSAFTGKTSTLSHPESSTKGSYQEWLCIGEYKEATADKEAYREFDRVKDDITFVPATDSSGNATGTYNIYLVDESMKQVKKEDAVYYGGYLLFETEKEANKALKQLQDKTGFALSDAFMALTATTKDDNGKESVVSATVSTNLTAASITDENLKNWLTSTDRKANDKAVVAAKDGGYYFAFFFSTEQTWTRTARDSWVESEVSDHIAQLVKDGGYEMNKTNLEKITNAPTEATTTTAAATK